MKGKKQIIVVFTTGGIKRVAGRIVPEQSAKQDLAELKRNCAKMGHVVRAYVVQ